MFLELSQIKKHLNIDEQFTEDDEYLVSLSEMAEQIVQKHIDCDLNSLCKCGELPSPLLHAILLMIGNMYANRESISYSNAIEIPFAYDYLLSLYKNYN